MHRSLWGYFSQPGVLASGIVQVLGRHPYICILQEVPCLVVIHLEVAGTFPGFRCWRLGHSSLAWLHEFAMHLWPEVQLLRVHVYPLSKLYQLLFFLSSNDILTMAGQVLFRNPALCRNLPALRIQCIKFGLSCG